MTVSIDALLSFFLFEEIMGASRNTIFDIIITVILFHGSRIDWTFPHLTLAFAQLPSQGYYSYAVRLSSVLWCYAGKAKT
ncbi:hypothetical protein CPB84DRAFT_511322 [Gymnopilus junonius]|uniref:Uncharacterized protein n=1 Tax=Gymnopilus junonius TaxID=109634 RepID=A0A9P5P0L5_GYMJU|nr:hypothetical protein CPB84DRAFT_511322 [Gymnopilus junonius]